MKLNVLVLPGDGIGTEVTREAVRVLRHVASKWNHKLRITEGLLGGIALYAMWFFHYRMFRAEGIVASLGYAR